MAEVRLGVFGSPEEPVRLADRLGPRHVELRMADLVPQVRDAFDRVVHLRRASLHREQADPMHGQAHLGEDAVRLQ
jgi:hypothetical protein